MMDVAPTVSAALCLPVPADAKGSPIAEIVADLEGMERVAVLAPEPSVGTHGHYGRTRCRSCGRCTRIEV